MSNSSNIAEYFFEMAHFFDGCYGRASYFRAMLPLLLLRRLDCVLESTKEIVLAKHQKISSTLQGDALDAALNEITGRPFYSLSPINLQSILSAPREVQMNLHIYIGNFSANVQSVFQHFGFNEQIAKLQKANLLFLIVRALCEIDLDPVAVSDVEMEAVVEQLFCHLNQLQEQEIGEHATPPDVSSLVIRLLFAPDAERLTIAETSCSLFDPVCGIGGMLLEARNQLRQFQKSVNLNGQEYNSATWAIAAARSLLGNVGNSFVVKGGDSLVDDQFHGQQFDYLCAAPPFGQSWKDIHTQISQECEQQGFSGRFGAGLPRSSDSSLLFLQHMLAKFKPASEAGMERGSRMAIVLNSASLLHGEAGSGESEIRKWLIEKDWLEAIIALPTGLHYNTGLGAYIWLLTNRKIPARRGKVQLIDAREKADAMSRSIGNKQLELTQSRIDSVLQDYFAYEENATSKIIENATFGYRRVSIERPLRLAFQITVSRKERFLDTCPELLDDLRVIEQAIGHDLHLDWNDVWARIQSAIGVGKIHWRVLQIKVFRDTFTEIDQNARPVSYDDAGMGIKVGGLRLGVSSEAISQKNHFAAPVVMPVTPLLPSFVAVGGIKSAIEYAANPTLQLGFGVQMPSPTPKFEADPALREYENAPLNGNLQTWLAREVLPYVPDAWLNPSVTKVGYKINFQQYFYQIAPSRRLADIDADLMRVEGRIADLLREVIA